MPTCMQCLTDFINTHSDVSGFILFLRIWFHIWGPLKDSLVRPRSVQISLQYRCLSCLVAWLCTFETELNILLNKFGSSLWYHLNMKRPYIYLLMPRNFMILSFLKIGSECSRYLAKEIILTHLFCRTMSDCKLVTYVQPHT